jgi:beta-galactosidase
MVLVMYICGEIHYFRVPKSLWRDRLLKLRRAHGNCISTYIPWNWHCPRENLTVFDDSYREWHVAEYYSRNLVEFLELASQLELKVIARPGPYICSEWDSGGHPNWLYTKTSKLRSLDPVYMDYTRKWYEIVVKAIKPYIERGVVTAIQIENEYFWGNEKYIEKLYNMMEKLAPDTLLFTNENYYLSRIPNTIDDYPAPWDIKPFEEKLQRYLSMQPGLFKMFMELEGGWFKSIKYGYNPTNRLSIPAEWTELLIKTALGMGIDNFNIYMFHGGTNPGYYTAKYIDSSYDYEAPIREWGELSDRYYKLKRVFTFLDSLRDVLVEAKPVHGVVTSASKTCSDVFARIGKHGKIIVLRNKTDFTCYEKVVEGGKVIPEKHVIRIPPRYAKIVVLDLEIKDSSFRIGYTTGELLLMRKLNDETTVVVIYGDTGETTETTISSKDGVKQVIASGDLLYNIDAEKSSVHIEVTHRDSDSVVQLESINGDRLTIVYTSKSRAERTWDLDSVVIISNIYYVGEARPCNNSLCIEVELDANSCGETTIITPLEIRELVIGETHLTPERVMKGVYRVYLPCRPGTQGKSFLHVFDKVELIEDPLWEKGVNIPPASPLESNGFYGNGIYVYNIRFELDESLLDRLSNKVIAIAGISDYAVSSLNGEFLASSYHYIERDAKNLLRKGMNELTVIVESTGHPNDGFLFVPNGIYTGLYLGKKNELSLNNWVKLEIKIPTGPGFDFAEFLANPSDIVKALSTLDNISGEKTAIVDSTGLYLTEIQIDEPGYHYVLDPGDSFYYNHYYRILLFINNEYVGPIIGPVEITKYLRRGQNKIALFVEWGIISPVLKVYEYKVNGEWMVQEGTHGLIHEWHKKQPLDSREAGLPLDLRGMAGRVVWLRTKTYYDGGSSMEHPLKLLIESHGVRLLLFVNANFIGRLSDDSPSRELYVPEPALRKGANNLLILAIITSNNAGIEKIELRDVYRHEKNNIVLKFNS